MQRKKTILSFVAMILVAIVTIGTFGFGKTVRAADDNPEYIFTDCATATGKVKNPDGTEEAYNDLVYCLEIMKAGPNSAAVYDRTLLSGVSSYDDDTKSRLMVVLMERDEILDTLSDLNDNGVEEAGWYKSTYWGNGRSNYVFQHLVWIIVSQDDFLINKDGPYGYKGVENAILKENFDYNDPKSLWQKVFVPLLKFIDAEKTKYPVGTAAGQYDAYFYTPDQNIQLLLGGGFVNKETPASTTPATTPATNEPTPASASGSTTSEPEAPATPATSGTTTGNEPTPASSSSEGTSEGTSTTPAANTPATTNPYTSGTIQTVNKTPSTTPEDTSTPTPAVSTGKDDTQTSAATTTSTPAPTEEVSTVTGTSENENKDSSKVTTTPTATPAPSSSATTDTSAAETTVTATPTPTTVTSKTTSDVPSKGEITDKVTKTGESTSYVTICGAVIALLASGTLLVIRAKKFKEEK